MKFAFKQKVAAVNFILCVLALPMSGQVQEYDYFPSALMIDDDVRAVKTYITTIDDPVGLAGHRNQLRLAKDASEETFFDDKGQPVRRLHYDEKGAIKDYLEFRYDDKGHLLERTYHHRAPASIQSPDSHVVVLVKTRTTYTYTGDKRVTEVTTTPNAAQRDSTRHEHDAHGQLTRSIRTNGPQRIETRYEHKPSEWVITTWAASAILSRQVAKLDAQGRLIHRENFAGEAQKPTSVEHFTYDPRGWLLSADYDYPGAEELSPETVMARQNFYDDHGKLLESIFDYANGNRAVHMYDYAYRQEE